MSSCTPSPCHGTMAPPVHPKMLGWGNAPPNPAMGPPVPTHPLRVLPFSVVASFSFSTRGWSRGAGVAGPPPGPFSPSPSPSGFLGPAERRRRSNSERGSRLTSSGGSGGAWGRGVAPGVQRKRGWNWTGRLRRRKRSSGDVAGELGARWASRRHGGVSTVPSIRVTCWDPPPPARCHGKGGDPQRWGIHRDGGPTGIRDPSGMGITHHGGTWALGSPWGSGITPSQGPTGIGDPSGMGITPAVGGTLRYWGPP